MTEKSSWSWRYSQVAYAMAEGIGIHGSFSVELAAKRVGRVVYVEIEVTSAAGNIADILAGGYVAFVVDGVESHRRTFTNWIRPALVRNDGPTMSANDNPFSRRPYRAPSKTRVIFQVEPMPLVAPFVVESTRHEETMTPVSGPIESLADVRVTRHKRELEVQVSVALKTPNGVAPSLTLDWSPKRFALE